MAVHIIILKYGRLHHTQMWTVQGHYVIRMCKKTTRSHMLARCEEVNGKHGGHKRQLSQFHCFIKLLCSGSQWMCQWMMKRREMKTRRVKSLIMTFCGAGDITLYFCTEVRVSAELEPVGSENMHDFSETDFIQIFRVTCCKTCIEFWHNSLGFSDWDHISKKSEL